jgi:hypothetical protein
MRGTWEGFGGHFCETLKLLSIEVYPSYLRICSKTVLLRIALKRGETLQISKVVIKSRY